MRTLFNEGFPTYSVSEAGNPGNEQGPGTSQNDDDAGTHPEPHWNDRVFKVFDALFYIRNKSVTNKRIHNSSIVCDISSRKVHEFNYWYSEISYSRFYLPLCKIVKSKVEWDTLRYKYGSKYITFQYIITF